MYLTFLSPEWHGSGIKDPAKERSLAAGEECTKQHKFFETHAPKPLWTELTQSLDQFMLLRDFTIAVVFFGI